MLIRNNILKINHCSLICKLKKTNWWRSARQAWKRCKQRARLPLLPKNNRNKLLFVFFTKSSKKKKCYSDWWGFVLDLIIIIIERFWHWLVAVVCFSCLVVADHLFWKQNVTNVFFFSIFFPKSNQRNINFTFLLSTGHLPISTIKVFFLLK